MSRHIEIDRLLAYAHGELNADETAGVIEHCESCGQCGNELGVLLALRHEHERTAADRSAGAGTTASGWPRFAKLAASIVLAVLIGAAALWGGGIIGAGATDPGPTDWAALATDQPPDQMLVDWLFDEARQMPSSVPGTSDTDPRAAERQLLFAKRSALELIVQRRVEDALVALEDLAATNPEDDEIATFRGIAAYLSGDTSEATRDLLARGARSSRQPVGRTAAWYLANHYLRVGESEDALIILESLAQTEDFPGENAVALLERLPPDVRR